MAQSKRYDLRGVPDTRMAEQIDDMLRDLYEAAEAGAEHALLSTLHTDVEEAASPVRGDLIVGNSTPAWERLPLATTSTHFVGTDGFDVVWRAIQETDIVDGSLLARLADNETITGTWRFSTAPVLAHAVYLKGRNSGNSADLNLTAIDGAIAVFGNTTTTTTFKAAAAGFLFTADVTNLLALSTTATTIAGSTSTTLAAGSNDNITAARLRLRLTGNASGSTLTGIVSGSVDGLLQVVTNVGTVDITLAHDATSTAANRFYLQDAADQVLPPKHGVVLQWNTTSGRWEQCSDIISPDYIENAGYYSPLTDGDPTAPELIFAGGDVVMVWAAL